MPLRAGDTAPDFTLFDDAGHAFTLAAQKGKFVVLAFYPKDDTYGCTREMCSFRDAYETLVGVCSGESSSKHGESDVVVAATSRDSISSHAKFKAKFSLPFTLLSDPNGDVHRAFGTLILAGLISSRTTFLIDPDGIIAHVYRADLQFASHAPAIRDALAVQRDVRRTRLLHANEPAQVTSSIREIPHS